MDNHSSESGARQLQHSIAYCAADACSTSVPVRGKEEAPGRAGARQREADCQPLIPARSLCMVFCGSPFVYFGCLGPSGGLARGTAPTGIAGWDPDADVLFAADLLVGPAHAPCLF